MSDHPQTVNLAAPARTQPPAPHPSWGPTPPCHSHPVDLTTLATQPGTLPDDLRPGDVLANGQTVLGIPVRDRWFTALTVVELECNGEGFTWKVNSRTPLLVRSRDAEVAT